MHAEFIMKYGTLKSMIESFLSMMSMMPMKHTKEKGHADVSFAQILMC